MIIASFPKGSFPENSWPIGTWTVAPAVVDIQYTEVMDFAVCIATSAEFDLVLPNDVEAVTGMVVVSGAGVSMVNGTYVENGTLNGKPLYIMQGQVDYPRIYIDALGSWLIYAYNGYKGRVYSSNESVDTPDLCTTWNVSSWGTSPVPTVASTAPNSGVSVTAAFTVEMPMIIDFELYEELSA